MSDLHSIIKGMQFFDPHVHMTSRTTDDYQAMAAAGVVALIEPVFWLGQPRTGVDTFRDYYSSLIGWEENQAAALACYQCAYEPAKNELAKHEALNSGIESSELTWNIFD